MDIVILSCDRDVYFKYGNTYYSRISFCNLMEVRAYLLLFKYNPYHIRHTL